MTCGKCCVAVKQFLSGLVKKTDRLTNLSYAAIYLLLTTFFSVHLYFVVSEHLMKMYVDITSYKDLEEYAPDVAICHKRPFVAHRMDILANYYGYRRLDRCRKLSIDILSLSDKDVEKKFKTFVRFQNILKEEMISLKQFDDIVIRCHSQGYKCGAEDFAVFPRYIRKNEICIIFKAKAFFRKVHQGLALPSQSESGDNFLSVFLKENWTDRKPPSSPLFGVGTSGLKVYLLDSGTAMVTVGKQVTTTNLIPYESVKGGDWTDITFSLEVIEKSLGQCSLSGKGYEILDEVNNTVHSFPYSATLCRNLAKQNVIKNNCGCYNIQYPVTPSMKADSFCQSIPAIFRGAKSLPANCKNRTISLLDANNATIGEESFDAELFTKMFCARKFKTFTNATCPVACRVTKGSVLETSTALLDLESLDEEFYSKGEAVNISDTDFPKYSVIRIRPSSWKIPVTKMLEVYPLSKLLSDLGGILGMWLGASMIGLVQLLDNVRRHFMKRSKVATDINVDEDTEKETQKKL